ncbi:MAG: peptidylprolyl isomerase [Phenylobacterium zucineum]|nr:MAG: peptidylprolyl isomerase [Phenylobacterium zucineum]
MRTSAKVTGHWARGAALAAVVGLAPAALAQAPAAPPVAEKPAALAPASVAAIVNDEIISTYDLSQRMRLLIATSGVQPTEQTLPQFQREALISLVDERLQLHELKRVEKEQKMDLIATDDEVSDEIADMAKQNRMTPQQFSAQMSAQGIGIETLRQQLRAQISWQRWIRGRYGSRLRIGDDQVNAQLQRIQASASKPQFQISEVFLDANRVGGMETAISGATQLIDQLQKGAPFQAVARQFSGSASAASGGAVGWISPGEMPPEVDAALEQMRPGQLSKPIQVRDGVYIILLQDKRAGASAALVSLKQAAIALPPSASAADLDSARKKLLTLKTQIKGCADLEGQAAKVPGVVAGDLGEAEIKDLAPAFRDAAQTLQVGQISDPIRTSAGLHILGVCGKRAGGDDDSLSREQIENRLFSQQLSMIARRYMRDLRNSATIETR